MPPWELIAVLTGIGVVAIPLLIIGLGIAGTVIQRIETLGPKRPLRGLLFGSRSEPAVLDELKALREQIAELRESTTRYDVSFDTALQRIEGRMSAVEQRVSAVEGEQIVDARGQVLRER